MLGIVILIFLFRIIIWCLFKFFKLLEWMFKCKCIKFFIAGVVKVGLWKELGKFFGFNSLV